ncbi:MAG: phosphate ABC transporter permease subunit PstC [Akkermansiaceae bacterium]|nr:phosphate ABC transporter permease subunit PstC [Armatimonadota bacterium]
MAATTAQPQIGKTGAGNLASRRSLLAVVAEKAITGWIYLCGALSVIFVAMIFLFVLKEAFPLFREYPIGNFFAGIRWDPTGTPEKFGLVPLLLSSVMVTLGAVLVAIPLGLMTAVYLAEIAPAPVRDIVKPAVELLAAIPSVVLGFFGVTILAPFLAKVFHLDIGTTMLAGSVTLAFMAIPTIATISEDALSAVGKDLKQGSLALGATRWETIRRVSIPAAFSGIIASIMLGIGRAIGETMVVLMVTGSGVGTSLNTIMTEPLRSFRAVFSAYGEICNTITATIASDMGEAVVGSAHYHALFLLGVVLFVITFIINLIADAALRKGHLQQ